MGDFFGTDGIRGRANQHPLTPEMAVRIGRAIGIVFGQEDGREPIIIGRDTRISGQMLEAAVAAGICAVGCDVWLARTMPTPGVAYLTRASRASAGVVISASHNPFEDNGIKVFNPHGQKLDDREEAQIETLLKEEAAALLGESEIKVGRIHTMADARKNYLEFLSKSIEPGFSLNKLKVVIDCANGAASSIAPELLAEMGAQLFVIFNRPNGININLRCGSEHPDALCAKVLEVGADVGLAFDGDGDRLIAVDEKGQALSGDQLLMIFASSLEKNGGLSEGGVVSTIMSNMGLIEALRKRNIKHTSCPVGDRSVAQCMRETGAVLGGESSGHMIFVTHHTTGDGLLSGLKLLEIMVQENRALSDLAQLMAVYPQSLLNVPVREKPPLEKLPAVQHAIREAEKTLFGMGRVLVRYSGTQAVCRVMVEGPNADQTQRLCERIAVSVSSAIGLS